MKSQFIRTNKHLNKMFNFTSSQKHKSIHIHTIKYWRIIVSALSYTGNDKLTHVVRSNWQDHWKFRYAYSDLSIPFLQIKRKATVYRNKYSMYDIHQHKKVCTRMLTTSITGSSQKPPPPLETRQMNYNLFV